ncbi:MAG: hypothetical protein IKQ10_05930 [Oscillospiraceae bacterium]|nr:hypothetical protein [Bacteroidales bacterium]MBR6114709.1 hypothetical protein [Oscillospiraceae bacterium]
MDTKEYSRLSRQLAQIIVQAYGKSPLAYDDLEEQVICAFTFGAHRAFSVASGVQEWESKILMVELLHDIFGFPMEIAGNALDFFVDCLDPEYSPTVNMVIHCGDDGYALLSDPEELGRQLKEIVFIMGSKLQVDDDAPNAE